MALVKFFRNLLLLLLLLYIAVLTSKTVQIFLLHKMNLMGSGWDDGAVQIFMENKTEFKPVILDMLDNNNMSAYEIDVTFTFAELLLDDEDIRSKLETISESHPQKQVRCFWHDVLNGRFEHAPVFPNQPNNGKNQFVAYRFVDNGTRCK
ncbi:hypothetical protein CWB99_01235 [Pseudoalteromonas rubra]|uniref:Uncharacterized protein n=1 Tax=Pseudoalteromonas rubra TaxID=43658 RepID=A0A5S3WTH6_9GAMM|nr:hypothetical protein [Pseudoalteromonas rubra]TMP28083.1 hypothetical protein CWC00_21960 [Pseudoalteromonas rubra]TMP32747.1 hypothetical protein CWB99_01235 [Pseudoalteromonas rubra]